MKRSFTHTCLLLLSIAVVSSCKKKFDVGYDNRPNPEPTINSSTRLVNLVGATELEINGEKLTSFLMPDKDGGYGPGNIQGTTYFPGSGRMSTLFTIPMQYVNGAGIINNVMLTSLGPKAVVPPKRLFNIKDNYNDPHDYYYTWFTPNTGSLQDSMFAIPRGISPSANPKNCRVRLLNLGATPDDFHSGAMSLSWADGTIIDGLANVAPGHYSEYIDVPYGSYQFKVLDDAGKQVPSKGNIDINVLNPQTGTLMLSGGAGAPGLGGFSDSWLTYAPLKTYQPGGLYTIVVARVGSYNIPTGNPGETVNILTNCFHVIADITEPINNTYARMQAVNVLPGKTIQWQVDGVALGSTDAFATPTIYDRFITGNHTIQALDGQGALLAEAQYQLLPGDNITAWAYPKKDGSIAISCSANNLSTQYFNGSAGNDGSYSMLQDVSPYWMRFMNFCTDMDEVTFTAGNGQNFAGGNNTARLHIKPGMRVIQDPYVRLSLNSPDKVLVYASQPDVVPGNWLSDIAPLHSADFIANASLYKTPSIPNSEPGIYTVALIGSTKPGAIEKARMIIIKHNQ